MDITLKSLEYPVDCRRVLRTNLAFSVELFLTDTAR